MDGKTARRHHTGILRKECGVPCPVSCEVNLELSYDEFSFQGSRRLRLVCRVNRACARAFCCEILFARGGQHAEILEKPDRPLRCPYLPTYLPTLLMGN